MACAWPLVRLLKSQPICLSSRLSLMRSCGAVSLHGKVDWLRLPCCCCCSLSLPQTQESGFAIIALMLVSAAFIIHSCVVQQSLLIALGSCSLVLRGRSIKHELPWCCDLRLYVGVNCEHWR
ncbi:hypothetical protein OK016_16445 [Vibrio chagasii]|nr:hypothetical protein [Vibrio chagasii]